MFFSEVFNDYTHAFYAPMPPHTHTSTHPYLQTPMPPNTHTSTPPIRALPNLIFAVSAYYRRSRPSLLYQYLT